MGRMLKLALCVWVLLAAAMPVRAGDAATSQTLRVVSLAPNLTETAFAIGAGDCLIGRTGFCHYPAEAEVLRDCGGAWDPNFEVLSTLHPDLIMVVGVQQNVSDFAAERSIAVEHFTFDSLAAIRADTLRMGELLGCEDGARALIDDFEAQLKRIEETVPTGEPVEVFVSLGHTMGNLSGLCTIAGGSFIDEAIRLAGGRNVFEDVTQPYPQVSKESLIARRPDVILELMPELDPEADAAKMGKIAADWSALGSIPAVRNGRVNIVTEDFILIPGPRFPRTVEAIRRAIRGDTPSGGDR